MTYSLPYPLTTTNMETSSIAWTMLSVIISGRASEVDVCLDKYVENSGIFSVQKI